MSATLLAHYERRARKSHPCSDCGGTIAASDKYVEQRSAAEGSVYTYRSHSLCHALFLHWLSEDVYNDPEDWSWDGGREALHEWWSTFAYVFEGERS